MNTTSMFDDANEFARIVAEHKESGWRDLDTDKKIFVCDYIKSGHTISVMTSGGKVSTEEAESYLRDPLVQAAIADASEQYAIVNVLTVAGWRAKLSRALDMALGEIYTPTVDNTGGQIYRKKVDLNAAARFLEMMVKYKDFKPPESEKDVGTAAPWER